MERWNSYNVENNVNEIKTFDPSVQTFEPTQNELLEVKHSDSIRCDIPVIVTRVEHHYYYHQYIYKPIKQREVHYYHHGQQQMKNLCQKGQFIDEQ